jgi:thymidylate synthase
MNKEEQNYLNLLGDILANGSERTDRTQIGTYGLFGTQLRFSLENNVVPMLTTKRLFARGVVEELLFFLRGETDTKKLEAVGVNIWKGNTSREFLDKRGLYHYPEGEMGPMYGSQWRSFCGVDQLANTIDLLKKDPYSRRIVVSAYNPSVSHLTVLEPCHMFWQLYVDDGQLSCQFYMRSVDSFLGLPFNILSYAILTRIVAKTVGMQAKELIFVGGDTHAYRNHVKQVAEQISRVPYDFPTMTINAELNSVADIENLKYADFEFQGYQCHPAIKAEMAV